MCSYCCYCCCCCSCCSAVTWPILFSRFDYWVASVMPSFRLHYPKRSESSSIINLKLFSFHSAFCPIFCHPMNIIIYIFLRIWLEILCCQLSALFTVDVTVVFSDILRDRHFTSGPYILKNKMFKFQFISDSIFG